MILDKWDIVFRLQECENQSGEWLQRSDASKTQQARCVLWTYSDYKSMHSNCAVSVRPHPSMVSGVGNTTNNY